MSPTTENCPRKPGARTKMTDILSISETERTVLANLTNLIYYNAYVDIVRKLLQLYRATGPMSTLGKVVEPALFKAHSDLIGFASK